VSTTEAFDFGALAAELKPRCQALVALYEQPRSALLPIMHLFQERQGYVSPEAIRFVADLLGLTAAEVEATVSFYTLLFRKPVGKYVLQVCRGLMCELNGAESIMSYFREKLGIGTLETTDDGLFSYEEVECLAACDRATCMQVNLEFVYSLTPQAIDSMIEAMRNGTYPVKPMAQTAKPDRTWKVNQDASIGTGGKSPGTLTSTDPDNAGGVGDPSGAIMLDHFVTESASFVARTRERFVRDARSIAEIVEEERPSTGSGLKGNGSNAGH